jgi:ABC-type sugar transport system permease subunit
MPAEIYETARGGGADPWKIFIRFTLPPISPTLMLPPPTQEPAVP